MPTASVTREVYYAPEQMFALVADVERYPEFVPYWAAVRVRNRKPESYHTDQVVRWGPMRHTFTTDTRLTPPERIQVDSTDAPFRSLSLDWLFHLAEDGGCRIDLHVSFELRLRALSSLGGLLSRDSMEKMVTAFEQRALHVYGPPARASHA